MELFWTKLTLSARRNFFFFLMSIKILASCKILAEINYGNYHAQLKFWIIIIDPMLMQNKLAMFWKCKFFKVKCKFIVFIYGKSMEPCKLLINQLSIKEA